MFYISIKLCDWNGAAKLRPTTQCFLSYFSLFYHFHHSFCFVSFRIDVKISDQYCMAMRSFPSSWLSCEDIKSVNLLAISLLFDVLNKCTNFEVHWKCMSWISKITKWIMPLFCSFLDQIIQRTQKIHRQFLYD